MAKMIHAALAATLMTGVCMTGAQAGNMILQEGVEKVDLTVNQKTYTVDLKEMSGGTSVNGANVQVLTDHVLFSAPSSVSCKKGAGFVMTTLIGFGAFNPTFQDALVVHQDETEPSKKYWNDGSWHQSAGGVGLWNVPINALKDASKPNYEFDALKIFNAEMQKFISNGGTKLEFLKKDRVIDVERNLSIYSGCVDHGGKGQVTALGYGTDVEPITMRIKYTGNPNLTNVAVKLGGNGQIKAGHQPIKVTDGHIKPYAPTYVGQCPANLKFRVEMKGQGKGQVRYRVHKMSNGQFNNQLMSQVYQSPNLAFDASKGGMTHDFNYQLPFAGPEVLNKTVPHSFRLTVETKDENSNTFETHYQLLEIKEWKSRCTPKVNVGLGGGGIKYDNSTPSPKPGSKVMVPLTPDPMPTPTLNKVQPVSPTPTTPPRATGDDDTPPARSNSR